MKKKKKSIRSSFIF